MYVIVIVAFILSSYGTVAVGATKTVAESVNGKPGPIRWHKAGVSERWQHRADKGQLYPPANALTTRYGQRCLLPAA